MAAPSRASLTALLTSLSTTKWNLTRTLRSTNENEINGTLLGTASFAQLQPNQDWLYTESGQFPTSSALPPALAGMAHATWSKKYIWRLDEASQLSTWFVKVGSADEPDYLFHTFDFTSDAKIAIDETENYAAPDPLLPTGVDAERTYVLQARGDHLCINDMYRTAYTFRFLRETEELVSWSSLHVVRGPMKRQEITNQYLPQ